MSKIHFKQRDTDFMMMGTLQHLATENGLAVMSFQPMNDGRWVMTYFNNRQWVVSNQLAADIPACTITSEPYFTFEDMVMGEIRKLKEKL